MEKRKNCWLIPTDKPSKLSKFLCNSRELYKTNELALMTELVLLSDCWKNQNIYITNDEEIKEEDYITDGYKVWQWKDDSSLLGRKKLFCQQMLTLSKMVYKLLMMSF